ncbi:hypothetical protein SNE26_22670 [Mucilaginibacter sp. cycad4]|uniref:hypothetical protein n=1 Tax=Mucilaginibacter sp. cycad4 TaxID=3342096 RepID=UPI002AAA8F84|nr:hypothetical protein [Mucilaginibacter gossypii]WPU98822.1 hypothetical protein SNE26_22670 [Mucilaginibacter gossypii]
MPTFKTKFNYPLYFFLLIISLIFCLFLLAFLLSVPQIVQEQGILEGTGIIIAGLFMLGYFCAQIVQIISTIRYGIIIADNEIILKDYLFWQRQHITNQIKGYSSSFYGYKNDIKCIIIYLDNKKHINLPHYLYWNYSEIEPALNIQKITFLGTELFKSNNIIFRAYHYDE